MTNFIKLYVGGIDWNAPTKSVLDVLVERYLSTVPKSTYPEALHYAEGIYASHKEATA